MDSHRANVQEFADLPAYTGPGIATQARKIIADLTALSAGEYIRTLDANVKACKNSFAGSMVRKALLIMTGLPSGCVFTKIHPHGSAYWTSTAAISTVQDGEPRNFFLKLTRTDVGLSNLIGEYTSMKAIHAATPDFSPVPLAVGTYAANPDIHFYLASYVDMTDEVPEVDQLPAKLAELHSKALSPNGKFGFSVPTNMGACVQPNEWTSSWEECFNRLISVQFEFEQEVHGHTDEMRGLHRAMLDKVIPRLLRPLETEGRSIQPRFVHGDLWDGNASVDATTDQPIIFDASGMYAHNEYELGAWNLPRHKIYRAYIQEYQRHFPPSAPEEDFEDRLMLYRYRFNLTSSGSYLDNMRFRALTIDDMKYLTTKYTDGYQGPEQTKAGAES
ncbi:hypothetical protein LTR85_011980 [Meristemomyces frigidus]|nr:hypothetical protein LTR85_011980 [Meristemomyces frigidus]